MPLINDYRINDYRLFLELHDKAGKNQHQFEIKCLSNCLEDFKFSAYRDGMLKNDGLDVSCHLEPVWEREGENPYCAGFRLRMHTGEATYSKEYSKRVFKYEVYRVVSELLRKQKLTEGMELDYRLAMFHKDQVTGRRDRDIEDPRLSFEAVREPLPIVEASLETSLPDSTDPATTEVWIADQVLNEMIEYVLQNKEQERAGFLIGHLCQDPATKKVFAVCPAQVAARLDNGAAFPTESGSSLTHFQFSPEVFFEVQRVIALRKKNELVLGWYHSHPWPFSCQKGDQCECTSVFFSTADFQVMEAAFGAPYQVAIVIGRASLQDMKATPQMYGWKDGLVQPRPFRRFDASRPEQYFQRSRMEKVRESHD
jgi:proteasome lid subunit RPN8/RPN11